MKMTHRLEFKKSGVWLKGQPVPNKAEAERIAMAKGYEEWRAVKLK